MALQAGSHQSWEDEQEHQSETFTLSLSVAVRTGLGPRLAAPQPEDVVWLAATPGPVGGTAGR